MKAGFVWSRLALGGCAISTAFALSNAITTADRGAQPPSLRQALTFHASFDGNVDATHATGDPHLYWAPSLKQRDAAKKGLPETGEARHAPGAGRFGDALQFTVKAPPLDGARGGLEPVERPPVVFYRGARNMPYETTNWSGTVSFWLNTDPRGALAPGFCDPVQITPRAWNDAAFFVEFEKRPESIPFRLGVYADLSVWNPAKRPFAEIPAAERPLLAVNAPPFARDRWTHVVFTFENFNTGRADGVARLYLDGVPMGAMSGRQQTFTWNPEETLIALGLNYIGLLDELSIFNRALTPEEIRTLHALPRLRAARYGEAGSVFDLGGDDGQAAIPTPEPPEPASPRTANRRAQSRLQ